MKLFTVGPVEMYEHTLQVAGQQLPYFRTEEFSNIMLEIQKRLQMLLNAGEDSKVVVLTGSGSSAMEAVTAGAFGHEDKLLIINGGTFGARFVKICQIYQIPYEEIHLEYGEILTREHFDALDGSQFTGILVNVHETSTGQLYDLELISSFAQQYGLSLVVDAISSFLADPYDMDRYGIDCTILSSQKALSLSPGISMLTMKDEFYHNKIEKRPPINLYLNIPEHVENMKRGQTPNTPAVGIILELADMLATLTPEKAQEKIRHTHELATCFRKEAIKIGLKIPEFPLSNALTPLYFPNGNAYQVYDYLKKNYEIYATPNGGDLKDYVLRIGHLGNIQDRDYQNLLQKMKEVI